MVKTPKVEQPKQYKVKKGYAWLGPDGSPSGAEVILENDPGFERQKYKLELITEEIEERDKKSSENRMGESKETRKEK